MREYNVCFDVPLSSRIILGMEAPEGEDAWKAIRGFSQGLVESLPGRIHGLYFLGNIRAYPLRIPRDFSENASVWYRENRGRICLINPVLESVREIRATDMVVLVCLHHPVDLEDWTGSPLQNSIILVNTGDAHFDTPFQEVSHSMGAAGLLGELTNRVLDARVTGEGFMPLAFELESKGQVDVSVDESGFSLRIMPGDERIVLHLRAMGSSAPLLTLKTERETRDETVGKTESSWFTGRWQPLLKEEAVIVKDMIERGVYTCPQCGKEHSADCLCCPTGGPVLPRAPLNTGVFFQQDRFFALEPPWYALAFNNAQGVFTREGHVYRQGRGCWRHEGHIKRLTEVDHGLWILHHTI